MCAQYVFIARRYVGRRETVMTLVYVYERAGVSVFVRVVPLRFDHGFGSIFYVNCGRTPKTSAPHTSFFVSVTAETKSVAAVRVAGSWP